MKKKIFAILLSAVMLLGLFTACGKNEAPDTSSTSGTTAAADDGKSTTASEADGKEEVTTEAKKSPAFFGAFESVTIDGKKVTEKVFEGNKLTMVNVWGTFCAPCIREMPDLQMISESYAEKGVKVIGIVIDTYDYTKNENNEAKISAAEDIIDQTGVKYMNILPSASLNSVKLDYIYSVPTTYFLNEKGEIVGTEYVGSRSFEQWSTVIDSILSAV